MKKNMTEKTDVKMVVGMIIFVAILVVMGGSFWKMVGEQAEKMKEEEALEEASAISAIYVETGEFFKKQFFVDMENGTVFTASIPENGIYNKKGKLIEDDVLENGDMIKVYGNGIMTRSDPAQYSGVTKIQRTGRASLEELQKYLDEVESRYGTEEKEE